MNIISDKEIKNLPVESKGGTKLGRVVGFEIDPESQVIINYLIKPKQVFKGILEGNLIINRERVIEINKKKMVVDEALVPSGEQSRRPEVAALPN